MLGSARHERNVWLKIPAKVFDIRTLDLACFVFEYIVSVINNLNAFPFPLATT